MEDQENDPGAGNVRVLCRFRPLNEKEKQMSDQMNIEFPSDNKTVVVNQHMESGEPLKFNFDYVFSPRAAQVSVYEIAARPIVEAVMQGFNGTVFAYGQTSSGKTFTMTGPDLEDPTMMGIIPRMVSTVFYQIENADEHIEFQVRVSYCEIYLEKIKDLLDPTKINLKVHEDRARGVYIADLTEKSVYNQDDVYELMKIGTENREVGATNMNAGSSRSHAIFILTVTQTNSQDFSTKVGKLYLVDLAGSEKVGKTGAAGKRLEEAKNINKSLTMLGLVITSLTDGKSTHIPYRDSKLTRVLQDSLGGNSKTALIVTCSPSPYNEAETIGTLRFGIRAKSIKNKPKINREYTVAELKLMLAKAKEEIIKRERTIRMLEKALEKNNIPLPNINVSLEEEKSSDEEVEEEKATNAEYLEVIAELEDTRTKLSEEIAIKAKMKQDNDKFIDEIEMARIEYENLLKLYNELGARIEEMDESIKEKDDLIEKLVVTKESLESIVDGFNNHQLELEQALTSKDVEINQLKIDLKMSKPTISSDQLSALQVQLQETQEENHRLEQEIEALQKRAYSALPKQAQNIEQFKEEALKKERDKWNDEKRKLIRELQIRVETIAKLEDELDDAKHNYKALENTLTEGERALKKKSDILERNLEQLTLMYHQLVSEKSKWTVEKKVSDRKNQRLMEKVKALEDQIKSERLRFEQLDFQLKNVSEELEERKSVRPTIGNGPARNIRKTIRGGGAKGADGSSTPGHNRYFSMVNENPFERNN